MFFVNALLLFLLGTFAILVLLALNLFLIKSIMSLVSDIKEDLDDY